MAATKLTIRVEGDPRDHGHVRLSDFLKQLEAVKAALRQTERVLLPDAQPSVYYRIVDARHSSPLTVVLEAASEKAPNIPRQVVGEFLNTIGSIKKKARIPSNFDYAAAEAYREIITPNTRVTSLVIANTRRKFAIDQTYEKKIIQAIGPDEFSEGSVSGTLDTVRLHNKKAFEIFPTIGPKRVLCRFPPELKDKVKSALERYVRVYGVLRYKQWDKFPHAVDAEDVEIYPPESELPSLADIRGMAPSLTDGVSPFDFLEKVRNAW